MSSPSKDWSKIPHPINNPNSSSSNNTLRPWKMPEVEKNALKAKEEEIEKHGSSIFKRRVDMDKKEDEIADKKKWIQRTKQQMKSNEIWIKEQEKNVIWEKRAVDDEVKLKNRKEAWVNQEKQKFPLDYPECQSQAEE